MKAILTNYHQSPRKVRLVADLIRGKTVPQARVALSFLMQKSSEAFRKLLESAVANSRNSGVSPEGLFVKLVSVDKGQVLRRARPFGRGRSGTLRKTHSILRIELAPSAKAKEGKPARKLAKKLEARS
ncbi:MAG: 50S ribosomal protein L22 [Candidatus Kaiserbacteria bacterium GW2011_GWA2_49_19]|uniref:Large ribosomal subunit protein uL22 n=2 Tax=Candidatus Kaiseribacteriota TaxID=1752734 RepID=A0A0G1VQD8_9BACT|nr:MAG: 50S ribosomal protein L22 [Candidatus Kaiserbacteria bacterium GW2011_GWA2_49_19]OGG60923.1 MAG: 50S ribosomal protein L22 [Candidatus Kaiserbacteria bacterium RIFCSPHIGHO2_02_FULL_49_16]